MSINAVIFDIGNVLVAWQPERFYDTAIGQARRIEMFKALDLYKMNEAIDRGDSLDDTVLSFAHANPDWFTEIMMWRDNWADMLGPAIFETVTLMRGLRASGMPVFALSNFGRETFDAAKGTYPFLTEFDRSYISGHLGVIKPHPRIYQIVEDDCGLDPATLLFIDDRAQNIEAAATRGWQTHLFGGPAGLAARLKDKGLL